MSTFFRKLFGNSENNKRKEPKCNVPQTRRLRVEPLESREMLSINPVQQEVWNEVTAKYSDLEWGSRGDYNYIEITAAQLSDSAFRDAIAEAGTTPENDLIVVRTTSTQNKITLAGTELAIAIDATQFGNVTIVSLGGVNLTIDANKNSRVFSIAEDSTATLAGLTITNGQVNITDFGGGILNYGTLTVANCEISENSSVDGLGGGIYNSFGTLSVMDCVVIRNSALWGGGGIMNDNGTVTVSGSIVSGNHATDTTYGGLGGGIYNFSGLLTVTNSLISENTIVGSSSLGGGVYVLNGETTLTNSTITGNSSESADSGSGVFISGGTLSLYNTIVAENFGQDMGWGLGTITGFHNLTTFTGWNGTFGNNFPYDPELPLFRDAANGDYRLAPGSQAIDKGNNDYVPGWPTTDLAGNLRIINDIVDIGAYESDNIKLTAPAIEDVLQRDDDEIIRFFNKMSG